MAGASGTNTWVGMGVETEWGTPVARTKFMGITGAGGGLDQGIGTRKTLTSNASKRGFWRTGKSVKIFTSHELDWTGPELWLKHAFGSCTSTQQGATSAYLHEFKLANTKLNSTIETCYDGKSLVREGCKITAVEFEGNLFDPVTAKFEYLCQDEAALSAPSSPSFPVDAPVIPTLSASTACQFYVDAALTSFQVQNWKVRLSEPLREGGFYIGNVLTIKEPGREDQREVTGEMTMEFDPTDANIAALYAAYQAGTESQFLVWYIGNVIESAYTEWFKLYCRKVVLTGKPPDISGPGIIPLTVTFEAFYYSADHDALYCSMQNATTSVP